MPVTSVEASSSREPRVGSLPKIVRARGWRIVKFTGRGRQPVSGWHATRRQAQDEKRWLVATGQFAGIALQLREYYLNAGPCTRRAYVSDENL